MVPSLQVTRYPASGVLRETARVQASWPQSSIISATLCPFWSEKCSELYVGSSIAFALQMRICRTATYSSGIKKLSIQSSSLCIDCPPIILI